MTVGITTHAKLSISTNIEAIQAKQINKNSPNDAST